MPKGAQRVQSTGKHQTSPSALTFSTPVQASSGLLEAQKGRSEPPLAQEPQQKSGKETPTWWEKKSFPSDP